MNIRQRTQKFIINFTEMCKTFNVPMLIGISIFTFGLMFALNQVTEFKSDDLAFMIADNTQRPTENFGDIIQSQIYQYFSWGGRMVAHVIARLLLWWLKPYSSIANALVIVALNIVCCYYGKVKNIFTLLLSTVLIYFLNADFEGTANWITGSCNYIWTILICLLFLIPYLHLLEKAPKKNHLFVIMPVWMLVVGVIAGWTNENIAPVVIIIAIAIMVINMRKKNGLPLWSITGVIGLFTGTSFMLLAPGNSVRSDYIAEKVNAGYGVLKTLMVRCYYMERAIFTYLFPTLLLGGVLLLIIIYFYRQQLDAVTFLFLCGGVLSVGAMFLSPTYPPRATFGSMIFFIVPILRMTNQIIVKNEKVYRIFCSAVWFGYAAFVMQMLTKILYTVLKGI